MHHEERHEGFRHLQISVPYHQAWRLQKGVVCPLRTALRPIVKQVVIELLYRPYNSSMNIMRYDTCLPVRFSLLLLLSTVIAAAVINERAEQECHQTKVLILYAIYDHHIQVSPVANASKGCRSCWYHRCCMILT